MATKRARAMVARGMAMVTRVAGNKEGDGNGSKSDGNSDEDGKGKGSKSDGNCDKEGEGDGGKRGGNGD